MKLFSFTRMGMYNTDPNWWDHNLALFEAITLPSMSQALHNPEDFWVLLVNKVSPIEAVRKLNTLIRNSPIRDKTYILYEDFVSYFGSQAKIHSDFVKQHVGDGEYFIKHQIDSDDAVAYDFFDRAREFVEQKTKEIGKESKFVFTFPKALHYFIRKQAVRAACIDFRSFNTFSYDNDQNRFPWGHQMRFSPNENFFLKNKYGIFSIDTEKESACFLLHGSSNYDLRLAVSGKGERGEKISCDDQFDYDRLKEYGVKQEAVEKFLSKFPEPLQYYETRHEFTIPYSKTMNKLKKELSDFYLLSRASLDYIDVEKSALRKEINKRSDKKKSWLENLVEFYEIECMPNWVFMNKKNGLEYLESLAASNHTYVISCKEFNKCCVIHSVNGVITVEQDENICRVKFTAHGDDKHQVWIKSINLHGNSMSSIEVDGLEYSMNLEGLNIVLFNGRHVADVVNINPKENFKLRR